MNGFTFNAGSAKNGQIISQTAIPARFRPATDQVFLSAMTLDGSSVTVRCVLTTGGIIHIQSTTGGNLNGTIMILTGISFSFVLS